MKLGKIRRIRGGRVLELEIEPGDEVKVLAIKTGSDGESKEVTTYYIPGLLTLLWESDVHLGS